ncbi:MAG: hypothetical protein H6953_15050 [Chromatiaceae bacterium]|nr:hypothetical protein [Chromatiaceae bacterium]MCP5306760.1 hypothetical protein [Chromatiaceae bacterium]MCP5421738.1 hypothetical protein [Chromatiaceae bacterium]MCP5421748.1 hypothetical protein [Chromatiaceae bacterium]
MSGSIEEDTKESAIKSVLSALSFAAFASYLAFGAISALKEQQWPNFMPPQFDLFESLLSVFGESPALYLTVALLVLASAFFYYVAWLIIKPKRAN